MPTRPDPYLTDDENPELTPEQIRAMRPASEVLPAEVYASLIGSVKPPSAQRGGALAGKPKQNASAPAPKETRRSR